jgi:hypothetical protein
MSDFSVAPTLKRLDPWKRVNYSFGLLLGVDEFQQEQEFLKERRRMHNRMLHGYGTAWGLRVELRPDPARGPQAQVSPGVAVNPQGQEICVPRTMCAELDKWLDSHKAELEKVQSAAPPFTLSLGVVLCYRECKTDDVPVAGEPCRTASDVMAASRIAESFELRLCLGRGQAIASPPAESLLQFTPSQAEEDAVRAFGALLERIEVTSDATQFATPAELAAAVRGLLGPPGSPPSGDSVMYVHPQDARESLRAAFRVWTTEVRPQIDAQDRAEACQPPRESCVLLAELDVPVDPAWRIGGDIKVREEHRPYVLHMRLLQEWLLCGRFSRTREVPSRTFASLLAPAANRVRAWLHVAPLLNVPAGAVKVSVDDGAFAAPAAVTNIAGTNVFDIAVPPMNDGARVAVRFDAAQIVESGAGARPLTQMLNDPAFSFADRHEDTLAAYTTFRVAVGGAVTSHAALTGLAADDHLQYLHRDGSRPMAADLHMDNHRIKALAAAAANGDAVRFEQAVKAGDPLPANSDLGGAYPGPQVVAVQGRRVAAAAPNNGDLLQWDASAAPAGQWAPAQPGFVQAFTTPAPAANSLLPVYSVVAAGKFLIAGGNNIVPDGPVFNGLSVAPAVLPASGELVLNFTNYAAIFAMTQKKVFVVKGTIIAVNAPPPIVVQPPAPAPAPTPAPTPTPAPAPIPGLPHIVVPPVIPGVVVHPVPAPQALQLSIPSSFCFVGNDANGIRIRVLGSNGRPLNVQDGFMVEISVYGA